MSYGLDGQNLFGFWDEDMSLESRGENRSIVSDS